MTTTQPDVDDSLPDLPALDGGEEDEAGAADEPTEELPPIPDDEADPFDDAEAVEVVGEWAYASVPDEDEASAAAGDEREVDIGEVELDAGDRESGLLVEADEPGLGDEALDIDEPPPGPVDDGGVEGLADLLAESIDEELPELDADEEGDAGDAWLAPEMSTLDLDDGPLPSRADVAWSAASERLGLGANETRVLALAFRARVCAVVTTRGELLLSRDRGETFVAAEAFRGLVGQGDGLANVGLGCEGREVHLLSDGGTRLTSGDGGTTFRRIERSTLLTLTTMPDGSIVAVGADPSRGLELLVSEQDPTRWSAHELPASVIPVAAAPNPVIAAARGAIALGSEAGLSVSRDAGATFTSIHGCAGTVAVAFVGDANDGALVAAVYREAEDRTYLVRVTVDGLAEIVDDVGAKAPPAGDDAEALGRATSLGWDATRGVLWVAGPFGVIPLDPGPGARVT